MTFTKSQAKENLAKLVQKFKSEMDSGRAQEYNEEETKHSFIDPFLKDVLGWDVANHDEVGYEHPTSRGRVDYSLKVDGKIRAFIEAKPIRVDLSKHIPQAVGYGYSRKDVPFVLLTDFEGIKLFDVTIKPSARNLRRGLKLDLSWQEYEKEFDKLWLLSKESVAKGDLDKLLLVKPKDRLTVDKAILEDLKEWRQILAKDIYNNNPNLFSSQDLEKASLYLKEITQKILDRLIFIRFCEDRRLTHITSLKESFEERNEALGTKAYGVILKDKFKQYQILFNSDLFDVQGWEGELKLDFSIIRDIVFATYDPYQFDVIPLEVLGNIYEQYLGYTIRLSGQQVKYELKPDVRKAGGVYYTPEYIVDYIVKNTVGKLLEELPPAKVKKLRILDPACGSGSFLISAYEEMLKFYLKTKKGKPKQEVHAELEFKHKVGEIRLSIKEKREILSQHIFGVDIDEQAVEVTKLSLMLKMLEGEYGFVAGSHLLPMLDSNIRCGNSLISGDTLELKKYFGDDWHKANPFNWDKQFPEIITKEGGFDVVIGNPPYVKARDYSEDKEFYRNYINASNKYETIYKMWDLYIPFVEKGTKLLKRDGAFSMIVPDTIEKSDYALLLREYLLNKFFVFQIDFFPDSRIFLSQNKVIGIKNTIIFVKKTRNKERVKRFFHNENYKLINRQDTVAHSTDLFIQNTLKIDLNKVETIPLGHICFTSYGLRLNSDKPDKKNIFRKADLLSDKKTRIHTRKFTEGKNLSRYQIKRTSWVEWNTDRCPKLLVRPTFPELYQPNKLLFGRQTKLATLDDEGYVVDNTIVVSIPYERLKGIKNNNINKYFSNINKQRSELEELSHNFDLRFILGIINSRLMKYYINFLIQNGIDMFPDDWKKIPIPANKQDSNLVALVDVMLDLNKKLITVQGSEKDQLQKQIEATDREIDDLVYKLYGITKEEKQIIEGERSS